MKDQGDKESEYWDQIDYWALGIIDTRLFKPMIPYIVSWLAHVCVTIWNQFIPQLCVAWWRHQMETFSALLAICAGNSPVPGEFPTQRPVTRSIDVFFDLRLNKRLSKKSWGWWLGRYRAHYDGIVMEFCYTNTVIGWHEIPHAISYWAQMTNALVLLNSYARTNSPVINHPWFITEYWWCNFADVI